MGLWGTWSAGRGAGGREQAACGQEGDQIGPGRGQLGFEVCNLPGEERYGVGEGRRMPWIVSQYGSTSMSESSPHGGSLLHFA